MLKTEISIKKFYELEKLQHISLFTIIVVVLLFFMHTALADLTVYYSELKDELVFWAQTQNIL
jgi:hypothetical protein